MRSVCFETDQDYSYDCEVMNNKGEDQVLKPMCWVELSCINAVVNTARDASFQHYHPGNSDGNTLNHVTLNDVSHVIIPALCIDLNISTHSSFPLITQLLYILLSFKYFVLLCAICM